MARAFSVSVVAYALGADPKWLDNLLTNNDIDGVSKAKQGVPRKLTADSIATIWVAKTLIETLGAGSAQAIQIAQLSTRQRHVQLREGVRIEVNTESVNEVVSQRLLEAVQAAPQKTRGRPPKRRHPTKIPNQGDHSKDQP